MWAVCCTFPHVLHVKYLPSLLGVKLYLHFKQLSKLSDPSIQNMSGPLLKSTVDGMAFQFQSTQHTVDLTLRCWK